METEFASPGNPRAEALWRELVAGAALAPEAGVAEFAAAARGVWGGELLARLLPRILDISAVSDGMERVLPRVEELLRAADPEALAVLCRRLLHPERRQLLLNAVQLLAPPSLVPLLEAAGGAYGMPVTERMRELLEKLARPVGRGRDRSGEGFREFARHLVERWGATQVSASFTEFERMFEAATGPVRASRVRPAPLAVVQVALDADAVGGAVWTALHQQTQTDYGARELIEVLKSAPAGRAVAVIAEHVATPPRLAQLLREEPLDVEAIDRLLPPLGLAAAAPLLDALMDAGHRATRRAIMDRLVRLGPEIQPYVLERLGDRRWYVVRNMMSLLRDAGCPLTHVPLGEFARHADGRVRRETLQLELGLRQGEERDEALMRALADEDKGVLRVALQAARGGLPAAGAALLAGRVTDPLFPAEYRVLALGVLGRSREPAALEALLHFARGGRTFFGRTRLAAKSPEMLAALGGLARSWPNERSARELCALARASRDPQVRGAPSGTATAGGT